MRRKLSNYNLSHTKIRASRLGRPIFVSAAAAATVVVVVAAAIVAAAAAVAEQKNQNDDPPPVVAAEAVTDAVIVTHKDYLRIWI